MTKAEIRKFDSGNIEVKHVRPGILSGIYGIGYQVEYDSDIAAYIITIKNKGVMDSYIWVKDYVCLTHYKYGEC